MTKSALPCTQGGHCPECGAPFQPRQCHCHCGWVDPQHTRAANKQCHYRYGGLRCPLPGIVSPEIGANARWYCGAEHSAHQNNPSAARVLLQTLLKKQRMRQARTTEKNHDQQ